jgi:hypothetical protein
LSTNYGLVDRVDKVDRLYLISIRQNGRFQVKVTVEFNRYSATFDTLQEAQWWRDKMLTLGAQIMDV